MDGLEPITCRKNKNKFEKQRVNMITYRKGSIFDVLVDEKEKQPVLTHACNCKGVWGSGFAPQLKLAYPEVYAEYAALCAEKGDTLLGSFSEHTANDGTKVLCLYTSRGYGNTVDSAEVIIDATTLSLRKYLASHADPNIHMPKINSGRFNVPWEKTEYVLGVFSKFNEIAEGKLRFTVWEP